MIYLYVFSYLLMACFSYGILIAWSDDLYFDRHDLTIFLAAIWPVSWLVIVAIEGIDKLVVAGGWIGQKLRREKD